MKIKLLEKLVYGRKLFYPKCDVSEMVAALIDKTCLTDRHLLILRHHNCELEIVKE